MLVGVLLAALSIKSYVDNSKLSNGGIEAMAEVVRIESRESSSGSVDYYTRIELPDAKKTLASISMTSETQNKYHVGEKLKVVYEPDHPMNVVVGGKNELSGGGFSLIFKVLIGCAIAGGGFFWIARSGFRET